MSSEFPRFLKGKDIIIASSYRNAKHLDEVRQVSRLFSERGQEVYPPYDAEPLNIDSDFVFLGGIDQDGMKKMKIERFFLEAIKKAKLMYVVTTNGYVGHSTSVEIAYSLAVGTPTFVSEQIRTFGNEVTPEIQSLITEHHPSVVPILGVQQYGMGLLNFANINENRPTLDKQERRKVFNSLLGLLRTLRD